MIEKNLSGLFTEHHTSIEQIKAAGWRVHTNMGGWWWEKRETVDGQPTRDMQYVPFWVRQMLHEAREAGRESVKTEFRQALGLPDPHRVTGPPALTSALPNGILSPA